MREIEIIGAGRGWDCAVAQDKLGELAPGHRARPAVGEKDERPPNNGGSPEARLPK